MEGLSPWVSAPCIVSLSLPSQAKLHMVASERDFAMSQLREMAEQVQTVAGEFKSMADHCDQVMRELEQVRVLITGHS